MKAELEDGKTLRITPEDVAEQEALLRFDGAVLAAEDPKPFTNNVRTLKATLSDEA